MANEHMEDLMSKLSLLLGTAAHDQIAPYAEPAAQRAFSQKLIRALCDEFSLDPVTPPAREDQRRRQLTEEDLDKISEMVSIKDDAPVLARISYLLSIWVLIAAYHHVGEAQRAKINRIVAGHVKALIDELWIS